MKYLEDIQIGERLELGTHVFTAEEIKRFAQKFDPQPFHIDEEAAKRSHFGGLCASGWHTAAIWMTLMIAYRRRAAEVSRLRGEPVARTGPSPGLEDIKWLKPVYVGDTLSYVSEISATRASKSKPGWGLMTMFSTATNQKGERVLSFVSRVFVQCRPNDKS